jgi:hypothetical protein
MKHKYELRKVAEPFVTDKKSGLPPYFQERKWATKLAYQTTHILTKMRLN